MRLLITLQYQKISLRQPTKHTGHKNRGSFLSEPRVIPISSISSTELPRTAEAIDSDVTCRYWNVTMAYFFPFFIALCTKSITAVAGWIGSSSANTKHSCSEGFCGFRTTMPKQLEFKILGKC